MTGVELPSGRVDLVVVGGGIVGLAVARAAQRQDPRRRIVVLEKEPRLAAHQTGRNSGVVHSGIYYAPGSLKALLVARSRRPLVELCERHGVPLEFPGKLVVATAPGELPRLRQLADRGHRHGLAVEVLDRDGIRGVEPLAGGLAAVRVPETGITDYAAVSAALAAEAAEDGAEFRLGTTARRLWETGGEVRVRTDAGTLVAAAAVVCAGLHSTRLPSGGTRDAAARRHDAMIIPFRGEYHELTADAPSPRMLLYPVPDPTLPFLGVHVTRGVDGHVHVGPNAVLATAVEGYAWGDVDLRHLAALAAFPGTRRLARRHWRTGVAEVRRSLSPRLFARDVASLLPGVTAAMLRPAPAGVRAQAVRRDGGLVDDFVVGRTARVVRVDNAPSPAATAALAIGEHVAGLL